MIHNANQVREIGDARMVRYLKALPAYAQFALEPLGFYNGAEAISRE
jgi:hypothetical protein